MTKCKCWMYVNAFYLHWKSFGMYKERKKKNACKCFVSASIFIRRCNILNVWFLNCPKLFILDYIYSSLVYNTYYKNCIQKLKTYQSSLAQPWPQLSTGHQPAQRGWGHEIQGPGSLFKHLYFGRLHLHYFLFYFRFLYTLF